MPTTVSAETRQFLYRACATAIIDDAAWPAKMVSHRVDGVPLLPLFAFTRILFEHGDHLDRSLDFIIPNRSGSDCFEPHRGTIQQHPLMIHFSAILRSFAQVISDTMTRAKQTDETDKSRVFAGTVTALFNYAFQQELRTYALIPDSDTLLRGVYHELMNGTAINQSQLPNASSGLAHLLKSVLKRGMSGN